MEPNNFEKKIKDKLASREIKPTEMAWDRLDAMLTMQENEENEWPNNNNNNNSDLQWC